MRQAPGAGRGGHLGRGLSFFYLLAQMAGAGGSSRLLLTSPTKRPGPGDRDRGRWGDDRLRAHRCMRAHCADHPRLHWLIVGGRRHDARCSAARSTSRGAPATPWRTAARRANGCSTRVSCRQERLSKIDFLSLAWRWCSVRGAAAHLMRFYTVPSAIQARKSVVWRSGVACSTCSPWCSAHGAGAWSPRRDEAPGRGELGRARCSPTRWADCAARIIAAWVRHDPGRGRGLRSPRPASFAALIYANVINAGKVAEGGGGQGRRMNRVVDRDRGNLAGAWPSTDIGSGRVLLAGWKLADVR